MNAHEAFTSFHLSAHRTKHVINKCCISLVTLRMYKYTSARANLTLHRKLRVCIEYIM